MKSFGLDEVGRALHLLSNWKRVAFMAACCDRMLPNYRAFSAETGWGDASKLERALIEVWRWIETDQLPNERDGLIHICDDLAPDTAEFTSIYTSAALDAANAIATTLEALDDASEDRAVQVASLARDTVDMYVQQSNDLDPNDKDIERKIIESPLMQAELRNQRQCLEKLQSSYGERSLIAADIRAKFSGQSLPGNPGVAKGT